MKKHFQLILTLLFLVALLILPYFVFATSTNPTLDTLTNVASNGGYQSPTTPQNLLPTIVGIAVRAALSLLGTIFIILIINPLN